MGFLFAHIPLTDMRCRLFPLVDGLQICAGTNTGPRTQPSLGYPKLHTSLMEGHSPQMVLYSALHFTFGETEALVGFPFPNLVPPKHPPWLCPKYPVAKVKVTGSPKARGYLSCHAYWVHPPASVTLPSSVNRDKLSLVAYICNFSPEAGGMHCNQG